jgi:hypothetical protein
MGDDTEADGRVTLIVAASYVVAIGIRKLPCTNEDRADDCSSTSDYINSNSNTELMGSGKSRNEAALIAGIVSHTKDPG